MSRRYHLNAERINQSLYQQTANGVPAARVMMSWAAVGVLGQLDYVQETYSHATSQESSGPVYTWAILAVSK